MAQRTARKSAFASLSSRIGLMKKWYKQKVHRANRKKLHQSDPQEHRDKPLDPWALD